MKSEMYRVKKRATSLLLNPLKQRLIVVTSFRFTKSLNFRSVLFKGTNNCGFVSSNHFRRRIY